MSQHVSSHGVALNALQMAVRVHKPVAVIIFEMDGLIALSGHLAGHVECADAGATALQPTSDEVAGDRVIDSGHASSSHLTATNSSRISTQKKPATPKRAGSFCLSEGVAPSPAGERGNCARANDDAKDESEQNDHVITSTQKGPARRLPADPCLFMA